MSIRYACHRQTFQTVAKDELQADSYSCHISIRTILPPFEKNGGYWFGYPKTQKRTYESPARYKVLKVMATNITVS